MQVVVMGIVAVMLAYRILVGKLMFVLAKVTLIVALVRR